MMSYTYLATTVTGREPRETQLVEASSTRKVYKSRKLLLTQAAVLPTNAFLQEKERSAKLAQSEH